MLAQRIQLIDQPIVTRGLIGRWCCGAKDLVNYRGGATSFTQYNSPTWVDGKDGPAFTLNGTNQYASASNINFGLNGATQASMALCFKTSDTGGRIFQKSTGTDGWNSVVILILNSKLYFSVQNQGQDDYGEWTSVSTVNNNAWHRAVFTWQCVAGSNADGILYLDNAVVSTSLTGTGYSSFFTVAEGTSSLVIGARPISITDFYSGSLYDMRLYNVKLTAGEAFAYLRGQG